MPKFHVTNDEWELMQELMFFGSERIEWGSREWKAYVELRAKLKLQA